MNSIILLKSPSLFELKEFFILLTNKSLPSQSLEAYQIEQNYENYVNILSSEKKTEVWLNKKSNC